MTNPIEELKEKIATMQHNLKVLEKLEAQKTDVEKAYRDAYGHYPETSSFAVSEWDVVTIQAFQKGYEAGQKPKEFQPRSQVSPEEVAELLDAMKQAKKEGVFDEPKITDEVVNKMLKEWEENPPDFLKFEMGKTLEELICKCMVDYNSALPLGVTIPVGLLEDILNNIEKWLPEPQSAAGGQDVYAECAVDGYNDALNKIKSKLRRKK